MLKKAIISFGLVAVVLWLVGYGLRSDLVAYFAIFFSITGGIFLLIAVAPKATSFTTQQVHNVTDKISKKAAYDELIKLKTLLNENIITQEEFDSKAIELKRKII